MASIMQKRAALNALMEQNGLLQKTAGGEEVKTKKIDAPEPTIGDQMQKQTEQGTQGNYASDTSVDASIEGVIEPGGEKIEGDDDKKADAVLAETGNPVKDMYSCGTPSGTPAQVAKSAALQQKLVACAEAQVRKEAALQAAQAAEQEVKKEASAAEPEEVMTATEVLSKVASLKEKTTAEEVEALMQDIDADFVKLAATNPLFNVACEQALIRKMAAEVDALAAANGIPPEEAAAALDAAVAEDPEAMAELNNEAEGEALSDLAAAEQDQAALMEGLDQTAAEVSGMIGEEVTADDLIEAVNQVVEEAEAQGVEPEVLLEQAAQMLESGADDGAAMEEAAAAGVSPDEAAAQAEPAAEPAPTEEEIAKEACLKKLASTKRGANLLKILEAAGK